MKKNKFMRLASYLLIATLMTTCTIGGTFAKYTTEKEAYEEARVAKWGIELTAQGEAFKNAYDADSETAFDQTVVAEAKVVAPGTEGTLTNVSINGSPEVAFEVTYDATLTLTGWEVDGAEYCPLIFTVGDEDISMTSVGGDVAAFVAAVEGAIEDYSAEYEAGATVDADSTPNISWRWEFEGDNEKDTLLGNLETAPVVGLRLKTTVTQID